MMTVMLLLALVFAAFGGLFLHVRAAQVNNDHTQADLPTLPHLQRSTRRYEHSIILLWLLAPYIHCNGATDTMSNPLLFYSAFQDLLAHQLRGLSLMYTQQRPALHTCLPKTAQPVLAGRKHLKGCQ